MNKVDLLLTTSGGKWTLLVMILRGGKQQFLAE